MPNSAAVRKVFQTRIFHNQFLCNSRAIWGRAVHLFDLITLKLTGRRSAGRQTVTCTLAVAGLSVLLSRIFRKTWHGREVDQNGNCVASPLVDPSEGSCRQDQRKEAENSGRAAVLNSLRSPRPTRSVQRMQSGLFGDWGLNTL